MPGTRTAKPNGGSKPAHSELGSRAKGARKSRGKTSLASMETAMLHSLVDQAQSSKTSAKVALGKNSAQSGLVSPDSIFAAIENHRGAVTAFSDAVLAEDELDRQYGFPSDPRRETPDAKTAFANQERRYDAANKTEERAVRKLCKTVPTTQAGTRALVSYIAQIREKDPECIPPEQLYDLIAALGRGPGVTRLAHRMPASLPPVDADAQVEPLVIIGRELQALWDAHHAADEINPKTKIITARGKSASEVMNDAYARIMQLEEAVPIFCAQSAAGAIVSLLMLASISTGCTDDAQSMAEGGTAKDPEMAESIRERSDQITALLYSVMGVLREMSPNTHESVAGSSYLSDRLNPFTKTTRAAAALRSQSTSVGA
jgi:hypothetical protein